jgi:cysteine synthase
MATRPPQKVNDTLGAIGNTPVVRLRKLVPEGSADVWVKLEFLNPTGSYKDRMAKSMIDQAEKKGHLKPGATVFDKTGGSTGSSLAFVCAIKGYKFKAVTSEVFAAEKLKTMLAFGSQLDIVHSTSGGIDAQLFVDMSRRTAALETADDHFWTDQFNNRDCLPGYSQIGCELLQQFPEGIDAFCGAVGVAGMIMGVSSVLKGQEGGCRVVVLEPTSSPVITKGCSGKHSVEGIGTGSVPPLLDQDLYDEALAVEEWEARNMCRRLAREEGILAGTSTGLNVVAALKLAKEMGPGKNVVTVACDTGLKYLSSSLFADTELG